jgi:hypothetical protein
VWHCFLAHKRVGTQTRTMRPISKQSSRVASMNSAPKSVGSNTNADVMKITRDCSPTAPAIPHLSTLERAMGALIGA